MQKKITINTSHINPNHKDELTRLNKVIGQLQGIQKMINEDRYCADILTQLFAVRSALKSTELAILNKHLDHCVTDSFINSSNAEDTNNKIKEVKTLLKLMNR